MALFSPGAVGIDLSTPAPPYTEQAEAGPGPIGHVAEKQKWSAQGVGYPWTASGRPNAAFSATSSSSLQATRSPDAQVNLPLVVKTDALLLGSGFKYNQSLFQLEVSPEGWAKLSSEIVSIAKPRVLQAAGVVTAGVLLESCGALGL